MSAWLRAVAAASLIGATSALESAPSTPDPRFSDAAASAALAAVAATRQVFVPIPAQPDLSGVASWLAWTESELLTLRSEPLRVTQRHALPTPLRERPQIDAAQGAAWVVDVDGVLTRWNLQPLGRQARVSAGLRTFAISPSRSEVLGVGADPPALLWFDAALHPTKWMPVTDDKRQRWASVSALLIAPARQSFVAVVPGLEQLWELSYNPATPDIAAGFIHDFRYREGAFVRGYRNAQRITLEHALGAVHLPCDGHELMGVASDGSVGVTHLDVRRRVATLSGLPKPSRLALDQAVSWRAGAQGWVAAPLVGEPRLALIDVEHRQVVALLPTLAPIAGLTLQPGSTRLWLRFDNGPHAGSVQVIDGSAWQALGTLSLSAQAVVDVSFDASGRVAVAVLQGAVAAIDPQRLRETSRLPLQGVGGVLAASDAATACPASAGPMNDRSNPRRPQ